MPGLSIIIAAQRDTQRFEQGLVSVLENRPPDCEVIAVFTAPYEDPYDLADEVRFLDAPAKAGIVDCIETALPECRAPVVHTLGCGVEVSAGWTEPVVDWFTEPRVATVAPLLLDTADDRRVVAAGVEYAGRGRRLARAKGRSAVKAAKYAKDVLGAPLEAGFFSREAITAVGGLNQAVGDTNADVDLAMRLRRAGYLGVFEPSAEVYAAAWQPASAGALRTGLCNQRLFLRNAPLVGWPWALAMHPINWIADLAAAIRRPATAMRWLGRAAACCEVRSLRRHWRMLDELSQSDSHVPDTARVDCAHPAAPLRHEAQPQQTPLRRAG